MIDENNYNQLICSKCGDVTSWGGSKKTDEPGKVLCKRCNGLLLDTGIHFTEYWKKCDEYEARGEDFDDYLIETVAIPYGEYNPVLKPKKTNISFDYEPAPKVKCPYCSSARVSKISTYD